MSKTVFVNGRVFKYDAETKTAEFCDALITSGPSIAHVGHAADGPVQSARQEGAEVVDLANRVVLPGFIDSHVHLLLFGHSLEKLDLFGCKSVQAIRQAVSEYAKSHPSVPRILCRSWLQTHSEGEGLASNLDDLDDRPIYIEANDLHSTWCNSAAMAELPMEEMIASCGDDVEKDENGKPTGLLSEKANISFVFPHLASSYSNAEKQRALKLAFDAYIQAGYTGAVDMLMDDNAWDALQQYREENGGLPLHMAAHWFVPYDKDRETLLQHVDTAIERHKQWLPSACPEFCVVGIKIASDGVVDGCTAALSRPYVGQTAIVDPIWPPEALNAAVQRAAEAGLQCAIHAIGDYAVTIAVDALASAKQPEGRHRIEHLECASAEDAARLGRLGITASVQPVHSDPEVLKAYADLIDKDMWERVFPYRELLDGHACVALGTDAPTARHLPLPNLYNATTRRSALNPLSTVRTNPSGALPLISAVAAATTGAAYSRFAEGWTGSLREGLQADLVVLDTAWTPESFLESSVYQTWSKGKKVFQVQE